MSSGASGDEDLYSDGPAEGTPAEEAAESKEEENKEDSVEAVLPKSILGGKKFDVGDEVVLKITAMHDDQISVAYAPTKGKDEGGEKGETDEGGEAKMPAAMMAGGGDSDYD